MRPRIAYKHASSMEEPAEWVSSEEKEGDVRLEYVGPEILGRHKWLGAAASPSSGVLWGIPGHARDVLRIDPYADAMGENGVSLLAAKLNRHGINRYKWLRGVARVDGTILGLPMHGDGVLKIEDSSQRVSIMAPRLPADEYKWHGGCVGANGCESRRRSQGVHHGRRRRLRRSMQRAKRAQG